jgi:hypothetical protein
VAVVVRTEGAQHFAFAMEYATHKRPEYTLSGIL